VHDKDSLNEFESMNFKLAAINLLISQFLILVILIFAYHVWFPHSLSEFIGFKAKAQLIIIVNIILGPILFLIICRKDKKTQKLDFTVLILLQLIAIIYGTYILYQKHPSYAVFTIDRFTLVDRVNSETEKVRFKELKTNIFSKTKLAFAKFPDDIHKRNQLMMMAIIDRENDLDKQHEYFEPYNNHINSVISKSLDVQKLFTSKEKKIKLKAQPIGIIDIDPWSNI